MTSHTDTAHHHADDVFLTQCAGWRQRILDALHEYQNTVSALERPPLRQYTCDLYGEGFLTLIAELRRSAFRIAAMIDDHPNPQSDDKVGYLTTLFADIRNPISSFAILDRLDQARPPAMSIQDTEVQLLIERLSAIGQNLSQLLDELLRLRSRFSQARE